MDKFLSLIWAPIVSGVSIKERRTAGVSKIPFDSLVGVDHGI